MKKMTRILAVMLALMVGAAFTFATPDEVSAASKKPAKVTITSVKSADHNAVKVTWKKAKNAKKYEVYRAASKTGKYKKVKTTTSRTFTNIKLTTGKKYYYKVRAVNGSKKGTFSAKKYAVPTLKKTTGTAVKSASPTSLKLSWNKVNGAKGYQIYRATSKNGKYTKIKTVSARSFTNTKLTTGKSYYYKVRAYKKVGKKTRYGAFSSVVSAYPVPAKTSGIKAVSAGHDRIKVSWHKVSGAKGYQVYRATSANGTYTKVGTTTSLSYTNMNLTPGKMYYYKVRAYTQADTTRYGAYSSVVAAYPAVAKVSGADAVKTDNGVKISWNKVAGAEKYQVYKAADVDGAYVRIATTASLSFEDTNVTEGTYYYKVRAYTQTDEIRYGAFSSVVSVEIAGNEDTGTTDPDIGGDDIDDPDVGDDTGGDDPDVGGDTGNEGGNTGDDTGNTGNDDEGGNPGDTTGDTDLAKTAGVSAASTGLISIRISWDAVEGAENYEVCRSDGGEYELVGDSEELFFEDTGLTAGKSYSYKVRACAGTVYGEYSDVVSAITDSIGKVTGITASADDSIVISWDEVAGAESYKVYRVSGDESGSNEYEVVATTSDTTFEDTNTIVGETYSYKVSACIGDSEGEFSDVVSGCVAPGQVNATAVNKGETEIRISWNEVAGAEGYKVYRENNNGEYVLIYTTTDELFYNDTGLEEETTYLYKVRAYVGNVFGEYGNASAITGAHTHDWVEVSETRQVQVDTESQRVGSVFVCACGYRTSDVNVLTAHQKKYALADIPGHASNSLEYIYENAPVYEDEEYVYYECSCGETKDDYTIGTPEIEFEVKSYNSIELSWNWTAENYEIYRDGELIKTTGSLNYEDMGLSTGRDYTYKIRGYTEVRGETRYGEFAEITAYTVPGETTIVAEDTSDTSILITWNEVMGAGGYEIHRAEDGEFSKVGDVEALEFEDTNLEPGKTYTYKVRAYIGERYGNFSDEVSAYPVPAKVTGVKAVKDETVTITWDEVNGADEYEVYRAYSSSDPYVKIGTTANLSYEDDEEGLYKVKACANGKTGPFSDEAVMHVHEWEEKTGIRQVQVGTESQCTGSIEICNCGYKSSDFTAFTQHIDAHIDKDEPANSWREYIYEDVPIYEEQECTYYECSCGATKEIE